MRAILVLGLAGVLAACGGSEGRSTTPDESSDLSGTAGGSRRSGGIPPGIDGTRWRWVEAYCTEGALDLLGRGYAATVQVRQDGEALTLITDQVFATEQCQHTLLT
ncbi:MAG: hypothetical protein KC619_14960, partial [Myxococcales bacterium]|nr:hypothetical protein [Myxococcales bacterium]